MRTADETTEYVTATLAAIGDGRRDDVGDLTIEYVAGSDDPGAHMALLLDAWAHVVAHLTTVLAGTKRQRLIAGIFASDAAEGTPDLDAARLAVAATNGDEDMLRALVLALVPLTEPDDPHAVIGHAYATLAALLCMVEPLALAAAAEARS